MSRIPLLLSIAIAAVLATGCISPSGVTPDEQSHYMKGVYNSAMERFYSSQPSLRELVKESAGHVVFTSVDGQYVFIGAGNGYGMAVDSKTGKHTHLKRIELGLGLGLGLRSYQTLIVFRDEASLGALLERGWDMSGDATAAFQAGEKGGSAALAGTPFTGVQIWELTDAGVILKLAVNGSKAWGNEDLNN
jgi:lipid-binding SYLF domain-containing protein